MGKERPENEGFYDVDSQGFFNTVNSTDDPKYPAGSYYHSMGDQGGAHQTVIYDSAGNVIEVKD